MNGIKLIGLAAICFSALSCSITEPAKVLPPEENPLPNQVNASRYYFTDRSSGQIQYRYDNQGNLLKKEWYSPTNALDFLETFHYERGKLVRIDRSEKNQPVGQARFTYANSQVSQMEYWMYNQQGTLERRHTTQYEYQQGQIIKTTHQQEDGTPSYFSLYTYTNGNITKIKSYDLAQGDLVGESVFEYDGNPNPFYQQNAFYVGSPKFSSRNNVIHERTFSARSNPQTSELAYAYTYNEKGYPTELFLIGKNQQRHLDESYTYVK
jgi:hypothetical protein